MQAQYSVAFSLVALANCNIGTERLRASSEFQDIYEIEEQNWSSFKSMLYHIFKVFRAPKDRAL